MDLKNDITLESLKSKSSNEILQLLKNKYPNPPRYINPKKFKYNTGIPGEAIFTHEWVFVRPEYSNNKYTGNWTHSGSGGILTNDEFIKELLSNTEGLEEAKIPTKGGRRRAQRKTKVKSKKRANKRRTRSRK